MIHFSGAFFISIWVCLKIGYYYKSIDQSTLSLLNGHLEGIVYFQTTLWLPTNPESYMSKKIKHTWLVVLTILKNMSQWEGLSHIPWKKKHVWNHQPDTLLIQSSWTIQWLVFILTRRSLGDHTRLARSRRLRREPAINRNSGRMAGWWLTYPSWKIWVKVNGKDDITYMK